jgi:hypothetical protein
LPESELEQYTISSRLVVTLAVAAVLFVLSHLSAALVYLVGPILFSSITSSTALRVEIPYFREMPKPKAWYSFLDAPAVKAYQYIRSRAFHPA